MRDNDALATLCPTVHRRLLHVFEHFKSAHTCATDFYTFLHTAKRMAANLKCRKRPQTNRHTRTQIMSVLSHLNLLNK